ncbi:MAG: CopG family transcriptional regulator, nickel-responsive regulator [Rhodospirillaceae bacterium]|jgi:CopG family nickel-responsive transcriptional regulator|nr:CopG family transcriptional regulator, nickel-responsive regulator [Rhodospirillaceae bacterium]MEA2853902.1 CopG family transcriptional regulator, nickel-responsive regulator [Rhodospirillaceae bacterium]
MQRITLSMDDELAAALDRHMKKHRYSSRSEALRDILRDAQARECLEDTQAAKEDGGFCVATLAYIYDHETRDLGRRLTQAQHKHHDLQVATLHVHLDHDSCLEVSVLRGSAKAVQALAADTVSQRGVRHGQLHVVPAGRARGRHSHGGGAHEHEHIHA